MLFLAATVLNIVVCLYIVPDETPRKAYIA